MALIPVDDPHDARVAAFRDIRERDLTGRQGLFVAEGEVVLRVLASPASLCRPVAALIAEKRLAGLADVERSRGVPLRAAPPPPGAAALSPREREVLALVAEGHSNRAIAEALFVSPNTVKTHVASLLRKHDASSRAQLAA